jgi:hypothetical protein
MAGLAIRAMTEASPGNRRYFVIGPSFSVEADLAPIR